MEMKKRERIKSQRLNFPPPPLVLELYRAPLRYS
jgi:hypothetical protein